MKPVTFIPPAEDDFLEALSFYEARSSGSARAFVARFYRALDEIALFPEKNQVVHEGVRQCLLPPFPFGMFYLNKPDRVVIVAVMHLARDSDYWKDRV